MRILKLALVAGVLACSSGCFLSGLTPHTDAIHKRVGNLENQGTALVKQGKEALDEVKQIVADFRNFKELDADHKQELFNRTSETINKLVDVGKQGQEFGTQLGGLKQDVANMPSRIEGAAVIGLYLLSRFGGPLGQVIAGLGNAMANGSRRKRRDEPDA